LALQFWLGLLSKRWPRFDLDCHHLAGAARSHIGAINMQWRLIKIFWSQFSFASFFPHTLDGCPTGRPSCPSPSTEGPASFGGSQQIQHSRQRDRNCREPSSFPLRTQGLNDHADGKHRYLGAWLVRRSWNSGLVWVLSRRWADPLIGVNEGLARAGQCGGQSALRTVAGRKHLREFCTEQKDLR